MHQQLIEQTIQITPQTMNQILPKLTQILSQITPTLSPKQPSPQAQQSQLQNIVKSIFYGLWNFDKMINQHNLSTALAEMLHKLPKKNAFMFLASMLRYLTQKWNLIDHHRINKFMQLVRYLIKQAMKISQKKTDQVLLKTVFKNINLRSGISDHVVEIYFDTACQIFLTKPQDTHQPYTEILPYTKLQIFQNLLMKQDSLQYLRLHIMQKIYQKYKRHIVQISLALQKQELLQKIQQFNNHILELAKKQECDQNRKNLYTLIGYMKSQHQLFSLYMDQKRQKLIAQNQKRQAKNKNMKKKISKSKKRQYRQNKKKKIQKKKQNNSNKKSQKVISIPKFQFRARQQMEKVMEA